MSRLHGEGLLGRVLGRDVLRLGVSGSCVRSTLSQTGLAMQEPTKYCPA